MALVLCVFCATERPGQDVKEAQHGKKAAGKYRPHCNSCKKVARGVVEPRAIREAAAGGPAPATADADAAGVPTLPPQAPTAAAQQQPRPIQQPAAVDVRAMATGCAAAASAVFGIAAGAQPGNIRNMVGTAAAAAAAAAARTLLA